MAFMASFLEGLPKRVEFSETAAAEEEGGAPAGFELPAGFTVAPGAMETHTKAAAFQEKNPGVRYIEAVQAVSAQS